MIKLSEERVTKSISVHIRFHQSESSSPRDAVNALLSLAYSMLAEGNLPSPVWRWNSIRISVSIISRASATGARVGPDGTLSTAHCRFRRAQRQINNHMITPNDFVQTGPAVMLKPEGRKGFFVLTSSAWIRWSRTRYLGIV